MSPSCKVTLSPIHAKRAKDSVSRSPSLEPRRENGRREVPAWWRRAVRRLHILWLTNAWKNERDKQIDLSISMNRCTMYMCRVCVFMHWKLQSTNLNEHFVCRQTDQLNSELKRRFIIPNYSHESCCGDDTMHLFSSHVQLR